MSERIPCKKKGCHATILQTTAERTGGYCMPCYQQMKRKEREEFIKKNRKDINLYDNIKDPVEILKIMHRPKKYNPLENYVKYEKSLEDMYTSICKDDIERMKDYVLSLIQEDNLDIAQDILISIVCYTNTEVAECLRALIKKNECYPEIIFRNAPDDVRDYLIKQAINGGGILNLNHTLMALAWIGDKKVVDLFYYWKVNPPKWTDKLYIPPEKYSLEAGWELTEDGQRRELFYEECYPLVKNPSDKNETVKILQVQDKCCEWCGRKLVNLFSFTFQNKIINISTCPECNYNGTIFINIDENGNTYWSQSNIKLDAVYEDDEKTITYIETVEISTKRRPWYYAASQFVETTFSQIGGHPTWIQDSEYPKCPKCSKYMKFVGQIDWEDIEEYGEGIHYAFICEECKVVGTNYQQT